MRHNGVTTTDTTTVCTGTQNFSGFPAHADSADSSLQFLGKKNVVVWMLDASIVPGSPGFPWRGTGENLRREPEGGMLGERASRLPPAAVLQIAVSSVSRCHEVAIFPRSHADSADRKMPERMVIL